MDVTTARTVNGITSYPTRGDLRRAVDLLCQMPKPPSIKQLEPIELPDRDGAQPTDAIPYAQK